MAPEVSPWGGDVCRAGSHPELASASLPHCLHSWELGSLFLPGPKLAIAINSPLPAPHPALPAPAQAAVLPQQSSSSLGCTAGAAELPQGLGELLGWELMDRGNRKAPRRAPPRRWGGLRAPSSLHPLLWLSAPSLPVPGWHLPVPVPF